MSISRKPNNQQSFTTDLIWLPDEVWMSILHELLPRDRFSMRAVNKYFKRLAEARGSWDSNFVTTDEVINIEKIIKDNLKQQLESNHISISKYQEAIKQLNEAKEKMILSPQDYESIKTESI